MKAAAGARRDRDVSKLGGPGVAIICGRRGRARGSRVAPRRMRQEPTVGIKGKSNDFRTGFPRAGLRYPLIVTGGEILRQQVRRTGTPKNGRMAPRLHDEARLLVESDGGRRGAAARACAYCPYVVPPASGQVGIRAGQRTGDNTLPAPRCIRAPTRSLEV